jgi:hypothetical protein
MTSLKHHIALYAALLVLAVAVYFLFSIATTVATIAIGVLLVLGLVLVFSSTVRTKFFALIGIPVPTSLGDILSDLNGLVSNLEQKATDLVNEAKAHTEAAQIATQNAATATAQAAHASKVADNVKTLIAP